MDEEVIDNLARETYHMRSRSAREMTDERWNNVKVRFPGTVRVLREEIISQINSGEFDE